MGIERVRRWQWLVLGVVVGVALWWSWRRGGDDLARYGECITDPAIFESALVEAVDGVPRFTRVRVHRQTLDDGAGSRATVHVVAGDYCDGRPDPVKGVHRWRPRFFLAPVP